MSGGPNNNNQCQDCKFGETMTVLPDGSVGRFLNEDGVFGRVNRLLVRTGDCYVECHRFPIVVQKKEDDYCGEFQPRGIETSEVDNE